MAGYVRGSGNIYKDLGFEHPEEELSLFAKDRKISQPQKSAFPHQFEIG